MSRRIILLVPIALTVAGLAACGDDASKGNDASVSNDASTNNSSGHDSGADGSTNNQQNGCADSYYVNTGCTSFEDKTGDSSVTVAFGGGTLGNNYSPKCLKVSKGTIVTFSGGFGPHPLRQGCGPTISITNTDAGANHDFVFDTVGDYGYYCNNHGSSANGTGMAGMIQVVE